jgi:phage repressor protein C with HTH and peptisase S24 domain
VIAMTEIESKVRAIMKATRWKQQQVAEYFQVSQSTVNRWLAGSEPEGPRRDAINAAYEDLVDHGPSSPAEGSIVPVMGYIGAGAEIEPEYDQVPPEGLDQIWIPVTLPDDLVAFEVRGISMLPFYKEGHIIVCYREQKRPLEVFFGEDAAVRTVDGRRFLKTIERGSGRGVNLRSFNAPLIENATIEWIGEIFAVLPRTSIKKIERVGGIQGQLRLG